MKKKVKVTIGVVAVLSAVAAAATWWVYKNRKEVKAESAKMPTFYVSEYPTVYNAAFPLKRGMSGNQEMVATLQKALNTIPPMIFPAIAVDGIFGPATEALLKNKLGVTEVSEELYDQLIKPK